MASVSPPFPFVPVASSDSSALSADALSQVPGSWAAFRRAGRVILLLSVVITLLVNPGATRSLTAFSITYGYTVMYSTGLWLANGYVVTWLNRRYAWTVRPVRRLLLTVGASLLASLAVIVVMGEAVTLLLWQSRRTTLFGTRCWRSWWPRW